MDDGLGEVFVEGDVVVRVVLFGEGGQVDLFEFVEGGQAELGGGGVAGVTEGGEDVLVLFSRQAVASATTASIAARTAHRSSSLESTSHENRSYPTPAIPFQVVLAIRPRRENCSQAGVSQRARVAVRDQDDE